MQYAWSVTTSMRNGHKMTVYGSDPILDVHIYRSVTGGLQYATITHLEISYGVNRVCHVMQNPCEAHCQVVKRILRYLTGSLNSGMTFQPNSTSSITLEGYCDVD